MQQNDIMIFFQFEEKHDIDFSLQGILIWHLGKIR